MLTRHEWLISAATGCRQLLVLSKDLEISHRLDGLPACNSIHTLDWLSDDLVMACTDTACVYWNLAEDPIKGHPFADKQQQQITSAACSLDKQHLCIGTVNGHVRTKALTGRLMQTLPLMCSR